MQYSGSKGIKSNRGTNTPTKKGSFGGKSQVNPLAMLQQKPQKEEEYENDGIEKSGM